MQCHNGQVPPSLQAIASAVKPIAEGSGARRVSFGPTSVHCYSDPGLSGPIVSYNRPPADEIIPPTPPATASVTRRIRKKVVTPPTPLADLPSSMFYTVEEEMKLFFPFVKSTDTAANRAGIRRERRNAEERRLPKPQIWKGLDALDSWDSPAKMIPDWGQSWPCDAVFRAWAV